MTTTSLFTEILISGIQGSIWVTLIVTGILGYDWLLASLTQLEKWITLVTILVLAFWYTLGIIIDRFSYGLFALLNPVPIVKKIKWLSRQAQTYAGDTRLLKILIQQDKINEFLDYFRIRARVMRSTALNLVLITISGAVFIFMRCNQLGCISQRSSLILIALGVGLLLFVIAIAVLVMLEVAYDIRLSQIEHECSKPNKRN